jgi:hypothetical protein
MPPPTNAAGMPVERIASEISQEKFYGFLEQEMRKIEQFTKKQVIFVYFFMNSSFRKHIFKF